MKKELHCIPEVFLQKVTDLFTLLFLFLYQLTLCEISVLKGVKITNVDNVIIFLSGPAYLKYT